MLRREVGLREKIEQIIESLQGADDIGGERLIFLRGSTESIWLSKSNAVIDQSFRAGFFMG